MATGYKLEYLRVSHQLVAELTAMAVNLVQGLLADKEHYHVLNRHPPKGDVHGNHAKDRKQHRGTYTDDECPTEKERSLRTIPRRHCHCRNLANGFSHCRGIYLAITHYPSDWFCRHIDMKTVRVVGSGASSTCFLFLSPKARNSIRHSSPCCSSPASSFCKATRRAISSAFKGV